MENVFFGGTMQVPQIAVQQLIYLDFDGETTSYNGEILTVDNVEVSNSEITAERIAFILAELNDRYAARNVKFVTERPVDGDYSTIFVGKTSAFEKYGNFDGLAETVDHGNVSRTDKAFVMLDSTSGDEKIIDTIAHETDHLLGILDHGGEGLARYTHSQTTYGGIISTKLETFVCNCESDLPCIVELKNVSVVEGGKLFLNKGTSATNLNITNGGIAYIENGAYVSGLSTEGTGKVYARGGGFLVDGATCKIEKGAIFTAALGDHDGIFNAGGTVVIGDSATFQKLSSSYRGGAICNASDGKMTIGNKAEFLYNVGERGGAICNMEGQLTIGSDVIFRGNSSWWEVGTAILNKDSLKIGKNVLFENNSGTCAAIFNYGDVTIGDNAKFINNVANADAGFVNEGGKATIGNNCVFSGNVTKVGGAGAVLTYWDGNTTIGSNAQFLYNKAKYYGGAIHASGAIVTLKKNASFIGNEATSGGAIAGCGGVVTIAENTLFKGNSAFDGGAIFWNTGTLNIGANTVFDGNKSTISDPDYVCGGALSVTVGNVNLNSVKFLTVSDTVFLRSCKATVTGNTSFAGNVYLTSAWNSTEDHQLINKGNVDFNLSPRTPGAGVLLYNWKLVAGTGTYSITVGASQKNGTYQLVDCVYDWAKFDQSCTLKLGNTSLGKISVGKTITNGTKQYSMVRNKSMVNLVVKDVKMPDLVIKNATFSSAKITAYDSVKLTFTVQNAGTLSAKASKVYIYDKNNKKIATLNVTALASKKSQTLSYTFKAGALPLGSNKFTLKADAAKVVSEASETNNNAAATVNVVKYDMQIKNVKAAAKVSNKEDLKITFSVYNAGSTESKASKVYIYDKNNKKIAGVNIAAIASKKSKTYSATIAAGKLPLGTNKLMLKADAGNVMKEVNETNNKVYQNVTVVKYDMSLSGVKVNKTSIESSGSVKFTFTVKNSGNTTSKSCKLYFYDSKNKKIDGITIAALQAGKSKTYTHSIAGSKLAYGSNKITLKVDAADVMKEVSETNNKSSKNISVIKYDMVLSDVKVNKTTIGSTGSVKFSFTVKNAGNTASKSCKLYFYDSKNKKIDGITIAALQAGKSKTYTRTISAGKLKSGSNKIIVKVDAGNVMKEADENNNKASKTIQVTAVKPAPSGDELFEALPMSCPPDLNAWKNEIGPQVAALPSLSCSNLDFGDLGNWNGDSVNSFLNGCAASLISDNDRYDKSLWAGKIA